MNKINIIPPHFIEVPVSCQESKPLPIILSIALWNCSDSVVFFVFHFNAQSIITIVALTEPNAVLPVTRTPPQLIPLTRFTVPIPR